MRKTLFPIRFLLMAVAMNLIAGCFWPYVKESKGPSSRMRSALLAGEPQPPASKPWPVWVMDEETYLVTACLLSLMILIILRNNQKKRK